MSDSNSLTTPPAASGGMAAAAEAAAAPAAPGADPLTDLRTRLTAAHDMARVQFDKTTSAVAQADRARAGMTTLAEMGDTVTQDDVIREVGKLVAHGAPPLELASELADMPQNGGGQALAGWIQQHVQQAIQIERQITTAHEQAKHNLGTAALHVMQAHSVAWSTAAPAAGGTVAPTDNAPAPNALTATSPTAGNA